MDLFKKTNRAGIGNMKGNIEQDLPENALFLWGAEADFKTAPCVRQALQAFADNGLYGFTLPDEAYRDRLVWWYRNSFKVHTRPEEFVPATGTVAGLSTAVRAFTEEGNGVVVFTPSYSRFDRAIRRNGRKVVECPLIEADGRYVPDLSILEEKLSCPENRLLLLVDPHNPTGTVLSRQELEEIARLAARYGTLVFSDEIFQETAEVPFTPFASVAPDISLSSSSLGKAFSLTGMNGANLWIPDPDIRAAFEKQRDRDHFGSIDPFFYTALRAAYTEEGAAWIRAFKAHTRENERVLREEIRDTKIRMSRREGTFLAWLDLRAYGLTAEQLVQRIEKEAGIYADPGQEYGPCGQGFYRLNLAVETDLILETAERLANLFGRGE